MEEFGLGKPLRRLEDHRLVTGAGRFTDDIHLDGQLRAAVVRSPLANARIVAVDTSAALRSPGVVTVLTGQDVAVAGFASIPCKFLLARPDGSPMFAPHQPLLAHGHVRYAGEPVAFVVAETHAQARDAADLVTIELEELDPAVTLLDAAKGEAPAVHEECPDNICFMKEYGNASETRKAFNRASHVVRLRLPVGRVQPTPLEPRGAIGAYEGATGRYTLYLPNQAPHRLRDHACEVLGIPKQALRVISPDVGGGFGNRVGLYRENGLVLWAAKILGRPVKWVSDRSESFMCDDQAREQVMDVELALGKDGNFLGLRTAVYCAVGAYLSPGTPVPMVLNVPGMTGVYDIPAAYVKVTALFLNTPSTSAYRGAGRPEAIYAIEMAIDQAARELGIDRFELRRRNILRPDVLPYANALGFSYDCGTFADNQEKLLKHADFSGFERRRLMSKAKGLLRGFGFANSIESAGSVGADEFGRISFEESGVATLRMGTHSHGQGHATAFVQMLSHFLGVGAGEVVFVQGDTDDIDSGVGTYGSRSAAFAGGLLKKASEAIIEQGRDIAADLLEAAPADIDFDGGKFSVAGTDSSVSLAEVAGAAARRGTPLDAKALFQPDALSFPNGSHACELEIDPQTGAVSIQQYTTVDDFGTVVNPLLVDGQLHGGIVQAIGSLLLEQIVFDDRGQLLTGSFMDYAMPRASDVCSFDTHFNPVSTKSNPLGIKGCGEAGTVGAFPAVMSAILDALSPLGVKSVPMPATPLAIWSAIREAAAAGA